MLNPVSTTDTTCQKSKRSSLLLWFQLMRAVPWLPWGITWISTRPKRAHQFRITAKKFCCLLCPLLNRYTTKIINFKKANLHLTPFSVTYTSPSLPKTPNPSPTPLATLQACTKPFWKMGSFRVSTCSKKRLSPFITKIKIRRGGLT